MTIIPEDKDWTWVLQRRCADCGFDAPSFELARTADEIDRIAARWRAVLGRDDVRARSRPNKWSPLEYGCHVRDVFKIFDGRLVMMLTEDDPLFANWDQDASAIEERYGEQDPVAVARDLADYASTMSGRYRTVPASAWRRPGRRSNGSVFTIDTFTRYMLHDPIHHLWDVGDQP